MKIGLSFSRCLKDIFLGEVDYEEVLIIIARTNCNPNDDKSWEDIWSGYHYGGMWSHPEWNDIPADKENEFRSLACMLYNDGKLHQPRQFGSHVPRRSEIWLETVLPGSELDKNPAAKKAWEHFQIVAGLTKVELDKDYQ